MISFETILRWKGFPIDAARRQLQQFNSMSREEKRDWIENRKKFIVEYHKRENPMYQQRVSEGSLIHWQSLPVLKKSDFQRPIDEVLSQSFSRRSVYFSNTSGSSGHPFFFARDKFSHALIWAYVIENYQKLGIRAFSKQARFYGIPLQGMSYYKELFKDYLMNRKRFVVFDLGDAVLEEFLNAFRSTRFDYLYGYTNSLLLFARYLKENSVILKDECPTLARCIVTSEVCTDEDKFFLTEVFGVPISREYGASELDVLAIEDMRGRWSLNESNLFIEVLDDQDQPLPDGEEGRLIVTSLFNLAMPFIRYEVGDVGSIERDEHGFILKKLSGRTNDTIVLPSGKRSPGFTFYYISRNILESSGLFREFIIRQTALDKFEFDAVLNRPVNERDLVQIKEIIDRYLEPGLTFSVRPVEHIQRPASGKIKHFYSELPK